MPAIARELLTLLFSITNITMNQRRLALFTTLFMWSFLVWGADLKISWHEGKDNLYNHVAWLRVSETNNGKPAAGASVYVGKELLGNTDQHGDFSSVALNRAAVKLVLKACLNEHCSDATAYQVLPSEYPSPVFISMGENPSASFSLTWHTAENIKVTVAECVRTDDNAGFKSQQVIRSKGTGYLKELIDFDKPEGKRYKVIIHKTTLSGLNPDIKYNYRIGDGKHWSEGTFQTAPVPETRGTVKFLFVADSQESSRENYQSYFRAVLNKAFETNPDIRFIAHAGDMVNHGTYAQEWDWAFEAGEKYFRNTAVASLVGNHETGGVVTTGPQQENQAYLSYSNNASNHTGIYAEGSAYSFDYGPAHLLCLDIQNLYDAMDVQSKTGEQKYLKSALNWIRKDLTTATTTQKWKIVTMHQPIYGANRDEEELRKVLAPVFDSLRVDLVITGHDHYYFRSFPMRYDRAKNDGEVVTMDQFGTVYIIGGSTCSKMYVQKFAKPYQAVVMAKDYFPGRYPYLKNEPLTQQNYSTFTVNPEELHYRFYNLSGELKDEVILKK
jgi:large repetitive protein